MVPVDNSGALFLGRKDAVFAQWTCTRAWLRSATGLLSPSGDDERATGRKTHADRVGANDGRVSSDGGL